MKVRAGGTVQDNARHRRIRISNKHEKQYKETTQTDDALSGRENYHSRRRNNQGKSGRQAGVCIPLDD